MASVNITKKDSITQIFDDFYNFRLQVDSNEYDSVYSYFKTVTNDNLAAQNFTVNIFQVSQNSNIPVASLLAEIQGLDVIELTAKLCYYLNNLRSNSTLLGINATVTPNFYAARNVLT